MAADAPAPEGTAVPTFPTPQPISVDIDIDVGSVRVMASDRDDTVVDVQPRDPARSDDVHAAELTQVDWAAGRLQVRTPKRRALGLFGRAGSVELTVEVPARSDVSCTAGAGHVQASGELGACRVKTGFGDIDLERTGPVELQTGAGAVRLDAADGDAVVSTGSGEIRLGSVNGSVRARTANGSASVREAVGSAHVRCANGDIVLGRVGADVSASTANGAVRIGRVQSGTTSVKTAAGTIEIGIAEGTAAQLDLDTHFGRIRSALELVDRADPQRQAVSIRARTAHGDIVINRA